MNAVATPPVMFPDDPSAQISAELGWYKVTAKNATRDLEKAQAEIARLREMVLEGVTRLENGADVEDVVQFLADGRYPAELAS